MVESIHHWVSETLVWALKVQHRAEVYHRSLVEGSINNEASYLQIKEAREQFQPMWLGAMEKEIQELTRTCCTTDDDDLIINEVEDKFYQIKPVLDTIDLVLDAIRRSHIKCVCETNETLHCPIHEARTFGKNMHGIDGSMGEFDTI